MFVQNKFSSALVCLALAALMGCGSSSNRPVPPPSGGFSKSNFNGTYVFSTFGTDVNGAFITIVGALQANGSGGITGGTLSFDDGTVGAFSGQTIGSGSYSVTVDGRGQASLPTSTPLGTVSLDFVLASSSHGLVTEFDGNGTGSGSIDLQTMPSQSQLAGSYAFSIAGVGSTASLATAGAFTLDASGNVTTGVQDFNNGGSSAGLTNLPMSTSSVLLGTGTAPGTAHFNAGTFNLTFDVYPVSSSHLKLVENDGLNLMSGDVLTQQTSLPSGTLVFTMAGFDSGGLPLALGGTLPTDSSGNVTAGLEDFNDGGNVAQQTNVTGSFTALGGGRSTLMLNGFENGATNDIAGTYTFAAYPTTGGTFLLEIDSPVAGNGAGVTSGVAMVQGSTSFAASQGYGLNLSALNTSNVGIGGSIFEEDDIAEFTSTSSSISGLIDFNDEGSITFDRNLGGTYSVASNGRGTATGTTGSATAFDATFYTVDGSTVLFIETDSNQIGTGVLQLQTTPTVASAVMSHFALAKPRPMAHTAWRHK